MRTIVVLLVLCISAVCGQYGDASGIGAGLLTHSDLGSSSDSSGFLHEDVESLWAFGVNGFFIPPPDFGGLPFLATNGTIIPTSAVGIICIDGQGGCSIELTAVVGGNLGRQVFNVSMNKVRFISSICRVRVSRLGRVVLTAKFAEVSSRLMPSMSLSVPLVVIAQVASPNFAFIEFDQFFVMQGQALRIHRFNSMVNRRNGKGGNDNYGSSWSTPGSPPVAGGGPGVLGGERNGNNNFNNNNNYNNNNNNRNNQRGVCPNLLDDSLFDGFDGSGNSGNGNVGNGGWGNNNGGWGGNGGFGGNNGGWDY